jgi:hypothetical protein
LLILVVLFSPAWGELLVARAGAQLTQKEVVYAAGAPAACASGKVYVNYSNGDLYTSNAGACRLAGNVGTVTGTGTTGKLPKWSNGAGGVLGDSLISESGTELTVNGGSALIFPNFRMTNSVSVFNVFFQNNAGTDYVRARFSAIGISLSDNTLKHYIGTGTNREEHQFSSDAHFMGSSTTAANGVKDVGYKRHEAGVMAFTNGASGGGTVKIGDPGARPPCDSTRRGTFWNDEGAAGVKDSVAVCAKDAADAYDWRTLY